MARYRRTDMDLAYGDAPGPAPERWDSTRFRRETDRVRAPVIEERPPYRQPAYYEDDRFYEDDRRYGPGGGFQERRYFEEDEYYDPRGGQGAMIPFRPARPARPTGPPRPGIIRRQSSLDRIDFDRRSMRRYDDYRQPPPPPRDYGRGRQARFDERNYDDIRVQDPDYYGDDGFREYREREWTRSRTRNDEPSPDRRTVRGESVVEEKTEERVEEKIEEKVVEKPYPRRGKTRMPKRLVHTKVLYDLGYSYYEEDEKTLLIEKALGPENIDEIFAKSKEYRERETITTRLLEAPPAASPTTFIEKREHIHESRPNTVIDERRTIIAEDIQTKPLSEAPRSVREWDGISRDRSISPKSSVSRRSHSRNRERDVYIERDRKTIIHEHSPARTHRSRRSRSHAAKSRRSSSGDSATIIRERKTVIEERSPSPARTHRTHRSRRSRGTSFSGTEIIERRKVVEEDIGYGDESNSIHVGPLALVVDRSKDRTDREIEEEIKRLQRERRDLHRERIYEREDRVLMEPSARGEVIIERRGEEVVEVRKDRKGRMSLVV